MTSKYQKKKRRKNRRHERATNREIRAGSLHILEEMRAEAKRLKLRIEGRACQRCGRNEATVQVSDPVSRSVDVLLNCCTSCVLPFDTIKQEIMINDSERLTNLKDRD